MSGERQAVCVAKLADRTNGRARANETFAEVGESLQSEPNECHSSHQNQWGGARAASSEPLSLQNCFADSTNGGAQANEPSVEVGESLQSEPIGLRRSDERRAASVEPFAELGESLQSEPNGWRGIEERQAVCLAKFDKRRAVCVAN